MFEGVVVIGVDGAEAMFGGAGAATVADGEAALGDEVVFDEAAPDETALDGEMVLVGAARP